MKHSIFIYIAILLAAASLQAGVNQDELFVSLSNEYLYMARFIFLKLGGWISLLLGCFLILAGMRGLEILALTVMQAVVIVIERHLQYSSEFNGEVFISALASQLIISTIITIIFAPFVRLRNFKKTGVAMPNKLSVDKAPAVRSTHC